MAGVSKLDDRCGAASEFAFGASMCGACGGSLFDLVDWVSSQRFRDSEGDPCFFLPTTHFRCPAYEDRGGEGHRGGLRTHRCFFCLKHAAGERSDGEHGLVSGHI